MIDVLAEYGEHGVVIEDLPSLAAYIQREATWRIVYRNDRLEEEFGIVCDLVYSAGDCLLVVEEADWFCNPTQIVDEFAKILRYGRHRSIHVVAVSRRPAEINRLLTSQASRLVCFRTVEPRDVDWLRRIVGEEASAVRDLPEFEPLDTLL